MKNYLLTVIGNFESDEMCRDMALTLSPIVDSPNLKFSRFKGALLLHFASEVTKEEIYDFVTGVFFGMTESFILTEFNDKMTVSLPDDMKDYLFNLDEDTEENNNKLDMIKVKNNYGFEESEDEDDFVALLLEHTYNKVKRPSLDQILDKISSKGYESLSQFEKDTLETYSKT
jgi:hypothetical protein